MKWNVKYMGAGLIAALALGTAGPSCAAVLGDVSGDSRVTVEDALCLLKVTAGVTPSRSRDRLLGDVWPVREKGQTKGRTWWAGDGELDAGDVIHVLRTAVGLAAVRDVGPLVVDIAGSGPTVLQPIAKVRKTNPALLEDGPAEQIYLFDPYDVAVAPNGEVFFSEYETGRIRMVGKDGIVRTLAGGTSPGYQDGDGPRARFHKPMGIALLPDGSVVVADNANHAIRKVTLDGNVTTIGGNGKAGYKDGPAAQTQFWYPNGVCTDPAGNVYVADTVNNAIRKISTDGIVTTLAGDGSTGFVDGRGRNGKLYNPSGVSFDPRDGTLYIADWSNHAVRKLTPKGDHITLAGNGTEGYADGKGDNARFRSPYGVDVDPQGRVWIADWFNGLVRVMQPDGTVTTAVGVPPNGGYFEGPPGMVKFFGLMNVRWTPDGSIYLADTDNERIRVLIP